MPACGMLGDWNASRRMRLAEQRGSLLALPGGFIWPRRGKAAIVLWGCAQGSLFVLVFKIVTSGVSIAFKLKRM